MDFDRAYREVSAFFGAEPDKLLADFWGLIPTTHAVLDIGVGQGRNALFLARKGFCVHGIDPSQEAIETVERISARQRLPIRCQRVTVEDYAPAASPFGAILVFGLIPLLSSDQIRLLIDRLNLWTIPGGLVFMTAFTVKDAGYEKHAPCWEPAGRHSFRKPDGTRRTYLEPGDLDGYFSQWAPIYSREGFGPKHRHGDGPIERHAMAELVVKKWEENQRDS